MSSLSQLEQVLIEDVLPVLKDDSLLSSHPIVVDVSSPAEITSVFDGISYSKVGYPPVVTLDAKEVVTSERRWKSGVLTIRIPNSVELCLCRSLFWDTPSCCQ